MFAISFICIRVVIIYRQFSSSVFAFIAFTIIVLLTFAPLELASFVRFVNFFYDLLCLHALYETFLLHYFTSFTIIIVCFDNVYFT